MTSPEPSAGEPEPADRSVVGPLGVCRANAGSEDHVLAQGVGCCCGRRSGRILASRHQKRAANMANGVEPGAPGRCSMSSPRPGDARVGATHPTATLGGAHCFWLETPAAEGPNHSRVLHAIAASVSIRGQCAARFEVSTRRPEGEMLNS